MSNDRLGKLLRKTLPPFESGASRRDLWPLLLERLDERPQLSLIDIGLGIGTVVSLLFFPEWLWLLAYHL